MRTRVVGLIALLALPVGLGAQGIRLPRPSERTPAQPVPPPSKEIPEVGRALSYQRSRWSGEQYGMISAVRVPPVRCGRGACTWWRRAPNAVAMSAMRQIERAFWAADAQSTRVNRPERGSETKAFFQDD